MSILISHTSSDIIILIHGKCQAYKHCAQLGTIHFGFVVFLLDLDLTSHLKLFTNLLNCKCKVILANRVNGLKGTSLTALLHTSISTVHGSCFGDQTALVMAPMVPEIVLSSGKLCVAILSDLSILFSIYFLTIFGTLLRSFFLYVHILLLILGPLILIPFLSTTLIEEKQGRRRKREEQEKDKETSPPTSSSLLLSLFSCPSFYMLNILQYPPLNFLHFLTLQPPI